MSSVEEMADKASEPKPPAPEQVVDWENEGGATPDEPLQKKRASVVRTLRRRARIAVHVVAKLVKENPAAALATAFGVGLVIGGGMQRTSKGRLILGVVAQPILKRAVSALLERA